MNWSVEELMGEKMFDVRLAVLALLLVLLSASASAQESDIEKLRNSWGEIKICLNYVLPDKDLQHYFYNDDRIKCEKADQNMQAAANAWYPTDAERLKREAEVYFIAAWIELDDGTLLYYDNFAEWEYRRKQSYASQCRKLCNSAQSLP